MVYCNIIWHIFGILSVILFEAKIGNSLNNTRPLRKNASPEAEPSFFRHQVQYIQVPEPNGLYYYPFRNEGHEKRPNQRAYMTFSRDELGISLVLLRAPDALHIHPQLENIYILLERDRKYPNLFIYNALSARKKYDEPDNVGIPVTIAKIVPDGRSLRQKRSPLMDKVRDTHRNLKDGLSNLHRKAPSARNDALKKIIHIPALFIDEEKDGFENIFYHDMIVAALCLTNQPELDRHEIRDEYEALVCIKKGYAAILPDDKYSEARKMSIDTKFDRTRRRRKRGDEYHYHDSASANFHLDKNKFDTLWRTDNNMTTTSHSAEPEIVEDLDYDYEFTEEGSGPNDTKGWDDDEVDPNDLDFIDWPAFLPVTDEEKVNDSDQLRSSLHHHLDHNYTLDQLQKLLHENHSEVVFDRRRFALNESRFLAEYYTYTFDLASYNYEKLIASFFTNHDRTLSKFYSNDSSSSKLTLESIRQLFLLYILDVHHINCFNRHIRFYGYVMKRPASINGDEITNNGRLTRGIVMRALELLRHIPQYNAYKELILRLLIASLKERAAVSKHSTNHVVENDYTELFEVASYLEHLLVNGIHPDEKNQDLFVQETRFYAHHFMNTLTL